MWRKHSKWNPWSNDYQQKKEIITKLVEVQYASEIPGWFFLISQLKVKFFLLVIFIYLFNYTVIDENNLTVFWTLCLCFILYIELHLFNAIIYYLHRGCLCLQTSTYIHNKSWINPHTWYNIIYYWTLTFTVKFIL